MSHPLEKRPEFVRVQASVIARKNRQWAVTLRVPSEGFPISGLLISVVTHHRGPSKRKAMDKALAYLASLRLEGKL